MAEAPNRFEVAGKMDAAIRKPQDASVLDEQCVAQGFELILRGLGLDLDDPHLQETPARAARAWFHELCAGITAEPPKLTTFPSDADEMVVLQNIPIYSLCSHHMLPFVGHATVGYIPGNGKLLGLSKLSRIANYHARRPQVQEQLTVQIAQHVADLVGVVRHEEQGYEAVCGGVGVVVRASHLCMTMRGVNHPGKMVTSAMRGIFLTSESTRNEFLQLATEGKG